MGGNLMFRVITFYIQMFGFQQQQQQQNLKACIEIGKCDPFKYKAMETVPNNYLSERHLNN